MYKFGEHWYCCTVSTVVGVWVRASVGFITAQVAPRRHKIGARPRCQSQARADSRAPGQPQTHTPIDDSDQRVCMYTYWCAVDVLDRGPSPSALSRARPLPSVHTKTTGALQAQIANKGAPQPPPPACVPPLLIASFFSLPGCRLARSVMAGRSRPAKNPQPARPRCPPTVVVCRPKQARRLAGLACRAQ